MNCGGCGARLPEQTRFCPHCGRSLVPATPNGGPQASGYYPPAKQGVPPWVWFAGGGLVLVAILVGLAVSGVFLARAEPAQQDSLRAEGTPPPTPLLQAQGEPPPPTLDLTTQVTEMPAHIRDWLEHLRITEHYRVQTATQQLSEALVLFTTARMGDAMNILDWLDPDADHTTSPTQQRVQQGTTDMGAQWVEIEQYFHYYPPPAECIPIRDQYATVLGETRGMISDLMYILDNSSQNPQQAIQALMGMRGQSQARIGGPARNTDRMVQEICAQFQTRPWFSITDDVGQSAFSKLGI